MSSREAYARRLQTQIAEWQTQIADYQAVIQESAGDLKATHEKNLETVQTALKQAMDIHEQVRQANETAWQHMQASTEAAVKQLATGWLDAIESYRPKR